MYKIRTQNRGMHNTTYKTGRNLNLLWTQNEFYMRLCFKMERNYKVKKKQNKIYIN